MTDFRSMCRRLPGCVVVLLLAINSGAQRCPAIPASPHPVELTQPDGMAITLHIRGDEWFHWHEDLDGYTVVVDQGRYVYAALDDHGLLAPTAWAVGAVDPRQIGLAPKILPMPEVRQRYRDRAAPPAALRADDGGAATVVPPAGTVKNLVILCKFNNHTLGTHTRPEADYDVLFNEVGGDPTLAPTGSVRDCFTENSYGLMTLESTVTAWVTLPETEAYYAHGNSGLGGSYPSNSQGMVKHCLDLVDPLIDFGDFDTDNDGFIDAISVVHSGYGAETGGGGGNWIWSHRWSLFQLPGGRWTSADTNGLGVNVKVFDYHTEPALWGTSGTQISRIGVIVHETGHFFGLPDLYDTNGGGEGIGSFCMMANSWGFSGSQLNPPHFSAWCKLFLGWATPTIITTPGVYTAPQVATNPVIFRINNGYPSGEYLLIENRQPVGFESTLPQGGLAIFHIDEQKNNNTQEGFPGQAGWPENNRHYKVAVLQADGQYHLEMGWNRGSGTDLYRLNGTSQLSATTVPNTDAYQGGNIIVTNNRIQVLSNSGPSMDFQFGVVPPSPATAPHDRAKNRYISFDPGSGSASVAFQVTRASGVYFPFSTGIVGWVDAPDANGLARLVPTPVFRVWNEPQVHVGSCAILPASTYEVRTAESISTLSGPLVLETVARPTPKFWGDTVGSFEGGEWNEPNGVVNTNDFLAALQSFQSLAGAPHVSVTDVQSVSSVDPCLNRQTNIADVFLLIKSFQGDLYPFTDPLLCPACP